MCLHQNIRKEFDTDRVYETCKDCNKFIQSFPVEFYPMGPDVIDVTPYKNKIS